MRFFDGFLHVIIIRQTSLWWCASLLHQKVGGAYVVFFALPGKDKRVTVFESLTLMIAFAVLIVTIMNSKDDKK
ncbi:hypothetical protein D8X92_08410 [Listeria ivanovii]|uniref:putative holin-like toxin n=1 Tax=Listeria ivanovii TaxID=1638 RepID=UPI0005127721|nr:putative holin-like toxin [Listeria ivanovii]AIS58734.1 hypothetical protein JL58_01500 [Listeria ivanovii subsp. londoniensis]AIS61540.1 hypothetical protein JL53_01840 [Listeria ivanovii subsp. londoniensis]MBK2002193.1 hypothetical protein [Listeria ivanovii subsp. londoniensis]MBM5720730.1 hypothetical protein [Listeria ivanovii]